MKRLSKNDIQKCELNMLIMIREICKKNHIKFLFGRRHIAWRSKT